jgi:SAM-dependent methyltransferase
MDHADHVELLRLGLDRPGGVWADVGAGTGAFTLALADMLGPGATIHVIDRDGRALAENAARLASAFPQTHLVPHRADFTAGLPLDDGSLDGVVMSNSLHFVRDKPPTLRRIIAAIRPGGSFLIVEYDADRGNPWVPWPVSYMRWAALAGEVGLTETRRVGRVPSRFLGAIYAASSRRPSSRRPSSRRPSSRRPSSPRPSSRRPGPDAGSPLAGRGADIRMVDSRPHGADREE